MELNVTNKIEDSLSLVTGIDRVISTSTENASWVDVFIDPDVKSMAKVKKTFGMQWEGSPIFPLK